MISRKIKLSKLVFTFILGSCISFILFVAVVYNQINFLQHCISATATVVDYKKTTIIEHYIYKGNGKFLPVQYTDGHPALFSLGYSKDALVSMPNIHIRKKGTYYPDSYYINQYYTTRTQLYKPILQFQTQNHKNITFNSIVSSHYKPYAIGKRLKVFYNPKTPSEVVIADFWYLWGKSIVFVFITIVLLILSVAVVKLLPAPVEAR